MSNHESYFDIPAVNWSSLKLLEPSVGGSPMLYQYRQENPLPDKPAFILGRAAHCAVLEPEKFEAEYVVYTGKVRRGKAWEAFKEEHADAEILKAGEMEQCLSMRDAVFASSDAMAVLAGGRAEETMRWTDGATGLKCKGRADYITPGYIADLKTTRDVAPRMFRRACTNFLYHGQMAYYADGSGTNDRPYIVAIQNQAPWEVVVYQMSAEAMAAGRALYRRLLDLLHACTKADHWPGVAPGVNDLDVERWAAGNEGDDTSTEQDVDEEVGF